MELGLFQREVAKRIGCSLASVTAWEGNCAQPKVSQLPSIIDFLGYAPLEPAEPWHARLARARQAAGLSRKGLAVELGVDESTITRWENGNARPLMHLGERLREIFGQDRSSR